MKVIFKYLNHENKIRADVQRDFGDIQREWISEVVSISELLKASFYDKGYWKKLQSINLGISNDCPT